MRRAAFTTGVLALAAAAPHAASGQQGFEPRGCESVSDGAVVTKPSERLRLEHIGGRRQFVLLPPGYDDSDRRYPVLYFFHGGVAAVDCVLRATDLVAFSAAQPPERQAIVVLPDGGAAPLWVDWRDGFAYERLLLREIIPAIDARYRTIAGRAHRAVAGFSGGGGGALIVTARHPDLFVAAASFSGTVDVDPDEADDIAAVTGATLAEPSPNPFAMLGDPATDAIHWYNANPPTLVENLRPTAVWLGVGDGRPCDGEDIARLATFAPFTELEPYVRPQAEQLHAALAEAGIEHRYDAYGCGIHDYRYAERDLHAWWRPMFRSFGKPAPRSFDHRRADPSFTVWGWSFTAHPGRAAEFLDIDDASRTGLRLAGSGTETVTSAGYFRRLRRVDVIGAGKAQSVRPDRSGRITFEVDLGPPHAEQQYTAQARLAGQDEPGYFKTRTVRLDPHARLLLGPTRGMRRARPGRPFRIRVRALGGRVRRVRVVVRDGRGRRVGRSRRFTVGRTRRRVRVQVTRRLSPGRFRIAAAGRDAAGRRARAVRRCSSVAALAESACSRCAGTRRAATREAQRIRGPAPCSGSPASERPFVR